uniref:Beta-mannosidase A n=1 Tax=Kalmanozyma brasiliensis (strain GHG001) TaxID=1365824 RepID=V5ED71_KALBG
MTKHLLHAGHRTSLTADKVPKQTTSDVFDDAAPAGLNWSLSNTNGSIQVDALFPSLAHLDLLRAGVIQDPSIGLNEGLYRWIPDEPTWTYTADLEPVLKRIRASRNGRSADQQQWLYFQGLDTIAQVYVGGKLIGETHNQHKWYAFRIPSRLVDLNATTQRTDGGRNTNITLVFNNTNRYAAQQADKFDPGYPNQLNGGLRPRTFDYEYPNRIFVRKQQSDFGWDWGPALVPVGPHKPAYLIALPDVDQDSKDITDASEAAQTPSDLAITAEKPTVVVLALGVDIYRKRQTNNLPPPDPNATWIVNVTLTLLSSREVSWPSLRLSIPSLGLHTFDALLSSSTVSAGLNEPVHATFEVPSSGKYGPELWWPRGYGNQTMYELVVHSDELKLEVKKRVGFRTAVFDLSTVSPEEVQQGVQPGSHFRLFVNDREVYVMGTNMIPLDTLGPRTNPAYLRWLLDSATYTHVNLVRIWGGGAYPSQELLDLCDERGIMVWIDAMFAASLYPYHNDFLSEVGGEIAQVMVDTVTHPSVVAVVGNNEGELFFTAYGKWEQDAEWKRGYELLFDTVIRDRVKEISRGLSYIPCSTTTGYIQLDPYIGRYDNYTRGVELHGTGEHYGYDATKAFDIASYPRSRFMVEFGMFSLPSIQTLDRILVGDYSVNSTVLRAHLKHPPAANLTYPFAADTGRAELLSAVTTYFPVPSASLSEREQLHRWSVSSQLFHALYLANQISVYRVQAATRERNRGLVVWQLNDVWEGTSWSSVEYGGAWKMVQYAMAGMQAPVAVVGVYNGTVDRLDVNVVWSGAVREKGGEVEMEWFDWTGRSVRRETRRFEVDTTGSAGAVTVQTFDNVTNLCGDEGCYLHLSFNDTRAYWTPMHALQRTLTRLHDQGRRPKLELSLPSEGNEWVVEVRNTGSSVAPWVWLEHGTREVGFFARCQEGQCRPWNGFWLQPGEVVRVRFVSAGGAQGKGEEEGKRAWFAGVTASSMFDNFDPSS